MIEVINTCAGFWIIELFIDLRVLLYGYHIIIWRLDIGLSMKEWKDWVHSPSTVDWHWRGVPSPSRYKRENWIATYMSSWGSPVWPEQWVSGMRDLITCHCNIIRVWAGSSTRSISYIRWSMRPRALLRTRSVYKDIYYKIHFQLQQIASKKNHLLVFTLISKSKYVGRPNVHWIKVNDFKKKKRIVRNVLLRSSSSNERRCDK